MEECIRFLKKEKGSAIRIFRDLLNKLTFKFVAHIRYEERNFPSRKYYFQFCQRDEDYNIFGENSAKRRYEKQMKSGLELKKRNGK